jgi:Lipase
MITKLNISPTKFHLIGHSLGAHVVSYVSNHTTGKIGRITGKFHQLPPYFILFVFKFAARFRPSKPVLFAKRNEPQIRKRGCRFC